MAEETFNMVTETDDEINNWIYFTHDPQPDDCSDLNTFTDAQSIHMDSTRLEVNDNEQSFQYDPDGDLINNEGEDQYLQDNDHHVEEQDQEPPDNEDDILKHNLILKETFDENGLLVEDYFCQHCNLSFNSIEDFLSCHPSIELLNDKPDQEQQEMVPTASEDKLWDLVENLDEVENDGDEDNEDVMDIKPNVEYLQLDSERYYCSDCQQVFTDLTTAESHECFDQLQNSSKDFTEGESQLVGVNADDMYKCHLCDKDYTSLRSFNNHQRCHKNSENLSSHTKTLHGEPTICEICNTIFSSEKNLKLHMKMHKKQTVKTIQEALPIGAQNEYNELSKFFCEICNKSFDQKLLVIHKNMHQHLEEYSCGKCNKQFENLPSYEIHMQMHADNIANAKKVNEFKKSHRVNIAEETPSTSAQGFINGGKRKHACQYCGKEFLRPYEKVKHERIHTGEKPYECEVCGKSFRVSYSLTLHLRTHTDIRPYVCATCNKRFKQQSVYIHHLKTHDVERGYKCEICAKSFRTSVQLSGHKNIHSKPYNCTECNRPFASLYAVKIHMKTHNKCHKSNKNLKNRCSICGASYARIFALRYHIKEHHGIDVDPTKLFAETITCANTEKEIDVETELLMKIANEASNEQMHFVNADDENHDDEVNIEDDGIFNSQVDHEENIQNTLPDNAYIDETEAATQTILNTEEISVDHCPTEKIITDFLSK